MLFSIFTSDHFILFSGVHQEELIALLCRRMSAFRGSWTSRCISWVIPIFSIWPRMPLAQTGQSATLLQYWTLPRCSKPYEHTCPCQGWYHSRKSGWNVRKCLHLFAIFIALDSFLLTFSICHDYFYRVKVSLLPPFHTPEMLQLGSSCLLRLSLNKSSSTLERVWLLLKLVFCWEMLTVLLKLESSLVTRSWESWNPTVSLQKFQKTCTIWLRRLSLSESIWKETERTRTLSSDWFWLNLEFTDWLDITELSLSCHQTGSTNLLLPLLWLTKLFRSLLLYFVIVGSWQTRSFKFFLSM